MIVSLDSFTRLGFKVKIIKKERQTQFYQLQVGDATTGRVGAVRRVVGGSLAGWSTTAKAATRPASFQ